MGQEIPKSLNQESPERKELHIGTLMIGIGFWVQGIAYITGFLESTTTHFSMPYTVQVEDPPDPKLHS